MLYKIAVAAEKHSGPCAGKPLSFDVGKDSIDDALYLYNFLENQLLAEFEAKGIDVFEISLCGPSDYATESECDGPMLKHFMIGRDKEDE